MLKSHSTLNYVYRLNEGHTVFVERKIKGRMFGEPVRQMSAAEGWTDLNGTVVR